MFQSPIRALIGSLLLNGAFLILLFSLNLSGPLPAPLISTSRAILLAPSPHVARQIPPPPGRAVKAASPRTPPRAFVPAVSAPQLRTTPPLKISAPEPLRLEVAPPTPELPHPLTAFAPPPLKTDNLTEVSVGTPNSAPRQMAKAPGAFDSAVPTTSVASRATATVRGGFGDATVAAVAPQTRANAPASPLTPVEILFKPRPGYTDEARRLLIQGEVLLQMVFLASGEIRVDRVVRGLGHGLDETAVVAARGIRFRAARRDGMPVDFEATVHIIFELAN